MQKIGNIEIGGKISIGTFLKGNYNVKCMKSWGIRWAKLSNCNKF